MEYMYIPNKIFVEYAEDILRVPELNAKIEEISNITVIYTLDNLYL